MDAQETLLQSQPGLQTDLVNVTEEGQGDENFMTDFMDEDDGGIIDYDDDDVAVNDDGDDDDRDEELNLDSDDEETLIDDTDYPCTPEERISRQEQLRMIHLRSYLNQLAEKVKHKKYLADKTREELKKCRAKIEELEGERDKIFDEIQTAESENNTASLFRLRSFHERLCVELESEEDLELKIKSSLTQAEYELNAADIEQGKFLLEEHELKKKEDILEKQKKDSAVIRGRKEDKFAKKALETRNTQQRQFKEAQMIGAMKQQQALEETRRTKEETQVYLKQTIAKIKLKEQLKEEDYKIDMQKKMDNLIKLKSDINKNRENLNAIKARDKAREREKELFEKTERQKILKKGGNPDQIMLIKQRMEDFENEKQKFEAKSKEKSSEILKKILIEEERMKRRKKQQPNLWRDSRKQEGKFVEPLKQKPLKMFVEAGINDPSPSELEGIVYDQEGEDQKDASNAEDEVTVTVSPTKLSEEGQSSDEDVNGSDEEDFYTEHGKVNLAKPEFEGLWDQHKPYKVPKDLETTCKIPGATKMQMEIIEKNFLKQKESIVTKQVAAGREFKGAAFYSKPDLIHFKDFDVGKSYKKKVILTNVSYSVNYCKFIGITEHLKDFIDILFDPPGQMSAGMTCDMMVTFKPMINEDLCGEVNFLAQTGPFSVPIKCTTKKCDLRVDQTMVDFGTTVIGENLKRTFILTNKGAQATSYEFFKITGVKPRTVTSAATSLGRLATASEDQTTSDTARGGSPLSESDKTDRATEEQPTEEKPAVTEGGEHITATDEGVEPVSMETSPEDKDEEGDTAREDGSNDFAVSDLEDYDSLDGMKVKGQGSGQIGAFSSVKLEVTWQPAVPGKVHCEFLLNFADPLSESISLEAVGNAIDVPVWVERQHVDLKICMYDRLYQDTILVNNRASTALRLRFEVCPELRNHLELLPKTGYIQAQSQFSAQLKFLPRKTLFEDASKYFDAETGVLEAPMIIRVADQTRPVPFTVQAVVTNSDLEFDVRNINFGCSTIYESVKHTIQLTNKSILPQDYGFLGLPEFVEIQPNDGFGTLLPLEKIELDVIFSPKRAREYKFDLVCKSMINRDFKISCVGTGVHPPLELSNQLIHFKATALYDISTASLQVVNSHTSMNEFTHPVPRIGKGEIAPVGPTSFEFVVPEGVPLTISPSVGTVEPGKKCPINVRFAPTLSEEDIQKEGVRLAVKSMEAQAMRDYKDQIRKQREAQEIAKKKAPAKKTASPKGKGKTGTAQTPTDGMEAQSGPRPVTPPDPKSIVKGSANYTSAIGSLLRQFKGQFGTVIIPCYVASGRCGNPGELPYSIHNTLYLEVHCPTVKPPVVVISDNGRALTDFGDISVGQHVSKSFTIQNISGKTLELSSSILDTNGPFQMLNAMRVLPPDASHTILLSFTPNKAKIYHEVFEVISPNATLYVTVCGRGVDPIINLSVDKVLDMGAVLAGEYLEKPFKIHNISALSVDYSIKLDSLSLLKHSRAQGLPNYLNHKKKAKSLVGVQNYNGQNVFDCVPTEGTIPPGATHEVLVTFAPDHASNYYSDNAKIELFHQEDSYSFQIVGVAKPHIMYLEGVDKKSPEIESLAADPRLVDEEEETKPAPTPVLFTLYSRIMDNEFVPASRELLIGCVRTMAVSQKKETKKFRRKSGEFTFDNIQPLVAKGFSIEPQKGLVEAGTQKAVTVTWSPPAGHDPNEPMDASIVLTLKGDSVEQIRIIMKAFVVSD